jgi:hypothetical protein
LTQALQSYERAARLAVQLQVEPAYDLEDQRWLALAFRSYVCGYRSEKDAADGCVDWARREVARFASRRPAAYALALESAA